MLASDWFVKAEPPGWNRTAQKFNYKEQQTMKMYTQPSDGFAASLRARGGGPVRPGFVA